MGVSFGGGSSASATNQTQSQSNVYSPGQTAVQDQTGSNLSNDLAAAATGKLTPGTTAQLTAADDATNKTASGLTDRVNSFLAARGFGKSGATGKTTLEGELGRESQIGNNTAAAYGSQNTLNQTNLLAALNYAFAQLGQTGTASGTQTGHGFNWGAEASVNGAAPGPGGSILAAGA